jgi:sugar phosphate isomerase/epimerase
MIAAAKKNHITTYIVNCNQQTIATEYKKFANECSKLSGSLRSHGIELWIHNNGAELQARVEHNGKQMPALSAVLDLCKRDNVGAQIDVGWVLYGGIDPIDYLNEVKDYVRSIHFKELKKDFALRSDHEIFACLGDGALKVREILDWVPKSSDITVLIDQDASDGDIMEDIKKSYQVLCKASK